MMQKYVNGELVKLTPEEEAEVLAGQPTAEEIKRGGIKHARDSGSITLLELVEPYSQEERETWADQRTEAAEWLLNNDSPCIMIRRIAYQRGITMDVMVDKIMENVELFKYVAGDILGVQQKAIDDIEAGV
jgi:hypothetical protein